LAVHALEEEEEPGEGGDNRERRRWMGKEEGDARASEL
jgi:hypothetical protein